MTKEKAAARRPAKLAEIRNQVAAGELVIRAMTKTERGALGEAARRRRGQVDTGRAHAAGGCAQVTTSF